MGNRFPLCGLDGTGMFSLSTYTQQNINRHTKTGFEQFICLAHGSTKLALEIKRAIWTPLRQSIMVISIFKVL